jgi:Acyltransferase family
VINQAFVMGLFFLLAGYFTPVSYDRKGQWRFIADRLLRLGVPLLAFGFVLHPLSIALAQANNIRDVLTLWIDMMAHGTFGSGPLWFLQTLLAFSVVYVLWRLVASPDKRTDRPVPGNRALLASALGVGVSAFLLRLFFPVDTKISGLTFGYFASYIFLFAVGISAARSKWLERVPARLVARWLVVSVIALVLLLSSLHFGGLDDYDGGWTIHSAIYAFFEPFFAWGVILGLLYLFHSRFNTPTPMARFLSARAYSVFVIHPPLLVIICRLFSHGSAPVLIKLVVASATCFVASVMAASLLLIVPGVRRVLAPG